MGERLGPAPGAMLSTCGTYRYRLFRPVTTTYEGEPRRDLCWVMLNPSTADATKDDPTIRKVRGFTERAGYDGFHVVNLFAWRVTDPRELKERKFCQHDVTGPYNKQVIEEVVNVSAAIVLAWGAQKFAREQAQKVLTWIGHRQIPQRKPLLCIGYTLGGDPLHPLMQSYAKGLKPYTPCFRS